jgi:hypothetical protein
VVFFKILNIFSLEIINKYIIHIDIYYFYFFINYKMPVFADALPMPGDLPINSIDPTNLSSI